MATGNNARIFRLPGGIVEKGKPANLVICDAPAGGVARDALSAIARGDIPGISGVIIDGQVQVGRSRNTPLATHLTSVVKNHQ